MKDHWVRSRRGRKFSGGISELPLDVRRAVHKLQSVQWREGQSLVQLATKIRDLHYQTYPSLAAEFLESYAGYAFIRCLLE